MFGLDAPQTFGGEAQRLKLVTELAKARIDTGLTRTGRASQPKTGGTGMVPASICAAR